MWPFKKKIKETPKGRMYGNRYNSDNYSTWDNMSFIEKFAMIFLPIGLGFIIYMMCDTIAPDLKWWIRLPISVGVVSGLMTLIWGFASWMSTEDWY